MRKQEQVAEKAEFNSYVRMSGSSIEGFQKIVALLANFDEKTGRHLRYRDPQTHYARKAVAVAPPASLRIYAQDLGGYAYNIIAEIISDGAYVVTAWVHEDGVRQERESAPADHPVHSIECLTDLLLKSPLSGGEPISEEVRRFMEHRA